MIVEADHQGNLIIPAEIMGSRPHERFRVERENGAVVVKRDSAAPETTEPLKFIEMAKRQPKREGPEISDEALRRENMYD